MEFCFCDIWCGVGDAGTGVRFAYVLEEKTKFFLERVCAFLHLLEHLG